MDKFGPYSQDSKGKINPTVLTGFDNEALVAWKFDNDGNMGIGPVIPFQWQPNIPDQQMIMGNAGIKWFNKKTIKTENVQVATNLYLQAPTSNDAHQSHMNFEIQTEPWIIYDLPGTRIHMGSWTTFSYHNGVTEAGLESLKPILSRGWRIICLTNSL